MQVVSGMCQEAEANGTWYCASLSMAHLFVASWWCVGTFCVGAVSTLV